LAGFFSRASFAEDARGLGQKPPDGPTEEHLRTAGNGTGTRRVPNLIEHPPIQPAQPLSDGPGCRPCRRRIVTMQSTCGPNLEAGQG
jgi:hypothetical protein